MHHGLLSPFYMQVLARARECFNTLSVKLDTQQYFFGDKFSDNYYMYSSMVFYRPTSLDAVVYGYLDNLIQYSLPGNNSLQGHVYCCDNLLQFCTRVRSRLYPDHKTGKKSFYYFIIYSVALRYK